MTNTNMKIGLFFGSFNPIHIGHVAIANFMVKETDLDQVWLVVSPHNPLKDKRSLADAKKSLTVVKKAIRRSSKIKVSDIELKLPQPSYTVNTLALLRKKFPKHTFVLIIGSDNLTGFHKWKDYKKILASYLIYVYPRFDSGRSRIKGHSNIKLIKAPRIDISSTYIREQLKKGKDITHLIPN